MLLVIQRTLYAMHSLFLSNISKCRTEFAITPFTSLGDSNGTKITNSPFAVIHSPQGNSNPFRGIIQPFRDISRDVLWIVKLAQEVFLDIVPSSFEDVTRAMCGPPGGGLGVLPTMAYIGRLRPKGVPLSGFRYIKE